MISQLLEAIEFPRFEEEEVNEPSKKIEISISILMILNSDS